MVVGVVKPSDDLDRNLKTTLCRQQSGCYQFCYCIPGNEFGHDNKSAAMLHEVDRVADIRVVKSGNRFQGCGRTDIIDRIAGHLRVRYLEGDDPLLAGIERLIDYAGFAFAYAFDKLVLADFPRF